MTATWGSGSANRAARRAASRRLPRAGTRVTVDIGDGRTVTTTVPGSGVVAALLRAKDAVARGLAPDGRDAAILASWLATEERRNPT